MGNATELYIYAVRHGLACAWRTRPWGSEWRAWAKFNWQGPRPIMTGDTEQQALDQAIAFQIRMHSYQVRGVPHYLAFGSELPTFMTSDSWRAGWKPDP